MADADAKEMATAAKKYWSAEGYTDGGIIREVDYATQSGGLDPMFAGIKIVDTDTHITEAPDLFTSRAPAALRDKMPHIKRVDGTDKWFVGDRDFGSMGGNVIRKDNNKLLGRLAFRKLEDAHPGGHQIKERLQAMDDMGVYAQVCYQNSGVTQAGSLMALGDPDLALSIIQIYNDASAEYQQQSGQRIFNMAHLPFWDQKLLETEARRCIDMGLKGFVLPDTPERVGVPSFLKDYWTPFLEMCNDTGTPLNFHLNAAIDPNTLTWDGFAFEQTLSVVATMFSIGNAATLGNWMVSGRLDRVQAQLQELLRSAPLGRVLQEGALTAIVGAPNVGKSSLLNALLREDRAIVAPTPGTTRDLIEATCSVRGLPLRLIDTAGQRDSADPVEQEGARRARELLPKARLVLRVVAAPEFFAPPVLEIPDGVPVLLVANKSDLGRHESIPPDAIGLCALTGAGLDVLEQKIEAALLGDNEHESPLTINARQDATLQRAAQALARAQAAVRDGLALELTSIELRDALAELAEVIGETTNEDILTRLFQNFCIGK